MEQKQQPAKGSISAKVNQFFAMLNKRERSSFWLMSGINVFFLLVMIAFAGAGILHCIAFWTVIQVAIIGYYIIVNKFPRKTKKREWIDAIAFAVVAATLIRTFFIEAYTIPTSSMEKSLLVGDFLFVSKVNYGARTPMTPISFPFAHNTLPVVGGKSYLEWFNMPYYRLPGLQKIKNNDVVVFNYPNENDRPVDKKENYIKRCLAIPGDTIMIHDEQVFINGKAADNPTNMQFAYHVKTDGSGFSNETLRKVGIREGSPLQEIGEFQLLLTKDAKEKLSKLSSVLRIDSSYKLAGTFDESVFPYRKELSWNIDNYGPLYVPKAGDVISLTPMNFWIYERAIKTYENNPTLEIKDDKVYLEGKEITSYTFKQNYYFMMGDNRHNSLDSRFWGFVPEDHIVGKALFIWMSWDASAPKFFERIRWNRLFHGIN